MTVFPQKLQRRLAPAFSKFRGAPHEGHLKGCVIVYFKSLMGTFPARRLLRAGFAASASRYFEEQHMELSV
jgi:hypothetical protein